MERSADDDVFDCLAGCPNGDEVVVDDEEQINEHFSQNSLDGIQAIVLRRQQQQQQENKRLFCPYQL